MASIEIEFEAKSFAADADKLTRVELPAVFRSALRSAANPIQRALGQMLDDKLDHPVPFSKRGFYCEVSNAAEPQMEIGVRLMQAKYLQYVLQGGTESGKVVPTEHTPLDAFGTSRPWPSPTELSG